MYSTRNEQSTQVAQQEGGQQTNRLLEFLVVLRGKLQQFVEGVQATGVCVGEIVCVRWEDECLKCVCVF